MPDQNDDVAGHVESEEQTAPERRPLPAWATSRTALASAAAVGVFLVGGLSGFAIGHAAADDRQDGDRISPVGFRDGGPGGRGDRLGGGPGFGAPDGHVPPGTEGWSESGPGTDS